MKIFVLILLALLSINLGTTEGGYVSTSRKYPSSISRSDITDGLWKSRTEWKFQWVKEWHVKKVFIPIWRKVWTPVEIKEWIPVPKALHK
ncbi:hypothetical protein HUJ04_003951 [Dendroctonus ponderosae]